LCEELYLNRCLISPLFHQDIVGHIHASLKRVCVLEKRATKMASCNIKMVWLYLPLLLNIIWWLLGSKDVLKYKLYASSKGRRWRKCFTYFLRRFLPFIFNTRPPEMQPLQRDNNCNKRNNNHSIQMNSKRNNNHDKGTIVIILG
jgi:hypothetical protein